MTSIPDHDRTPALPLYTVTKKPPSLPNHSDRTSLIPPPGHQDLSIARFQEPRGRSRDAMPTLGHIKGCDRDRESDVILYPTMLLTFFLLHRLIGVNSERAQDPASAGGIYQRIMCKNPPPTDIYVGWTSSHDKISVSIYMFIAAIVTVCCDMCEGVVV